MVAVCDTRICVLELDIGKMEKDPVEVTRLTDLVVEEVSLVDRPANKWAFTTIKNDSSGSEVVSDGNGGFVTDSDTLAFKAVWTTAYMNDLPDGNFLYIKPGGRKDETGRTVPRALRMFPYKDANGRIDLPHLRNAIARIPQAVGLSADLKDRLQARARNMLEQARKTEGEDGDAIVTSYAELAKNVPSVDLDTVKVAKAVGAASGLFTKILGALVLESTLDSNTRYEIGKTIDFLIDAFGFSSGSVEKSTPDGASEDPVSDPGQLTPEQFSKFLVDLQATITEMTGDTAPVVSTQTQKSDSEQITNVLQGLMETMVGTVDTLKKAITEKNAEINRLRQRPVTSNAASVEELVNGDPSKRVTWARDMAVEVAADR